MGLYPPPGKIKVVDEPSYVSNPLQHSIPFNFKGVNFLLWQTRYLFKEDVTVFVKLHPLLSKK